MRLALIVLACLLFVGDPTSARAQEGCAAPDDNRCELWTTTWDSGENETRGGAYPERPTDLAIDGNWLYTTGESYNGLDNSKAFILKTNATTGELVWAKRFSGIDGSFPQDIATSIAVSPDGSTLYVSGTGNRDFRGRGEMYLASFSSRTGRHLWSRTVDKQGRSWGVEADVISNNHGAFIIGYSRLSRSANQIVVARYSAEGNRIWKRTYGSLERSASSSGMATDGRRVFIAASLQVSKTEWDKVTIALDQEGDFLWDFRSPQGIPASELRYRDGRLYLFGGRVDDANEVSSGIYALGASTGEVLWSEVVASAGAEPSSHHLALSPDGLIAYAIGLPDLFGDDLVLRAHDSAKGTVLWTTRYAPMNGRLGTHDAVASDEGVAVGAIAYAGEGRDLVTLTFTRDAGILLWSARFNPSPLANAEFNDGILALGPNGIVIHASDVYDGQSERGSGYARNDVVMAAYQ